MSHIVNRPVAVKVGEDGRPTAFRWAGRWQWVAEVLEEWVYRQPWWELPIWGDAPGREAESAFFRVRVEAGGVFEVALDPGGAGRLYRVFD